MGKMGILLILYGVWQKFLQSNLSIPFSSLSLHVVEVTSPNT